MRATLLACKAMQGTDGAVMDERLVDRLILGPARSGVDAVGSACLLTTFEPRAAGPFWPCSYRHRIISHLRARQ